MSLFGAVLLGLCLLAMYTYFTRNSRNPKQSTEDDTVSEKGQEDSARLSQGPKGAEANGKKPALTRTSAKRAYAKRASDPPSVYDPEYWLLRTGLD